MLRSTNQSREILPSHRINRVRHLERNCHRIDGILKFLKCKNTVSVIWKTTHCKKETYLEPHHHSRNLVVDAAVGHF